MKKTSLILFLSLTISLISCNDDDGPSTALQYAEITGHNLPDYFELGEDYEIDVTYKLPNACNTFAGFDHGGQKDEDDETIFIYYINAVTSYDPNLTECDQEGNLTSTKTVRKFSISENSEYKMIQFKLLKGISATNEPSYITVNVPVGEPEAETPEETPAE